MLFIIKKEYQIKLVIHRKLEALASDLNGEGLVDFFQVKSKAGYKFQLFILLTELLTAGKKW